MADSKRNSTAGKVAMPKGGAAPAPLPDMHEAIAKAIGAHMKVTTAAPDSQTYEGTLYTADPITSLIVLNVRAPTTDKAGDYRVIPISRIQSFQIVSLANGDADITNAQPMTAAIDTARLQKRLDDRVAALKDLEKNKGKGVTKEGQAIFDAFKRINLDVRWHERQIIVHDTIIVPPPYRPEDCKSPKDKQEVLNRIKKVLEGERRKLAERERKTPTPNGPRKGG